jgi:hypothetical protein
VTSTGSSPSSELQSEQRGKEPVLSDHSVRAPSRAGMCPELLSVPAEAVEAALAPDGGGGHPGVRPVARAPAAPTPARVPLLLLASTRAHHCGRRTFASLPLDDAFLPLGSHDRQNESSIWVVCWRRFWIGKHTVDDVFWVWVTLLEIVLPPTPRAVTGALHWPAEYSLARSQNHS